jgi:hypothetical protein
MEVIGGWEGRTLGVDGVLQIRDLGLRNPNPERKKESQTNQLEEVKPGARGGARSLLNPRKEGRKEGGAKAGRKEHVRRR